MSHRLTSATRSARNPARSPAPMRMSPSPSAAVAGGAAPSRAASAASSTSPHAGSADLLGALEVGAANLHANAANRRLQLPRHDLVRQEAFDSLGVEPAVQELRRGPLADPGQRDEIVGLVVVWHGPSVARR